MTKPKGKKGKNAANMTNALQDPQDVKPVVITFKSELALLLHGFGDIPRPLEETSALLDEVVHNQISQLILLAYDVAQKRQSSQIGQEEFIYLLRKNKTKLWRLLNCLYLKAVKKSVSGALDVDVLPTQENEATKKLKSCINFLELIDNTGEYECVYENLGEDLISHRRTFMAYQSSETLDDTGYTNFSKCRQFSFTKHMGRFQQWFAQTLDSIPIRPSKFGWELLAYFAHETAAEVIECSLIVQKEQDGVCNPHFSLPSPFTESASPDVQQDNLSMRAALKPAHIYEVLRRFVDQPKPGLVFSRAKATTLASEMVMDSMNTPVVCIL